MKSQYCCIALVISSLFLLLSLQSPLSHWQTFAQETRPRNVIFQLPKIFDWNRYKLAFQKVYPTIRDELARKKLFVANALKTFLHNLAFRMGKSSHYQSVNQFTDNTPEELSKLYSSFKPRLLLTSRDNPSNSEPKLISDGLDLNTLKLMLSRIIQEKQSGYEILARQLQDTIDNHKSNCTKEIITELPGEKQQFEAAENSHNHVVVVVAKIKEFRSMVDESAPKESEKFVSRVPSTNEYHESLALINKKLKQSDSSSNIAVDESLSSNNNKQLSLLERIAGSDIVKRKFAWLSNVFKRISEDDGSYDDDDSTFTSEEDDGEFDDLLKQSSRIQKGGSSSSSNLKKARLGILNYDDESGDDDIKMGDKIYLDYRDDGCLTVPRDQKKCGSCYAFAVVALMEWWHCTQTGKLVAFSEQYMVDCGRHVNLFGCEGGDTQSMETFVRDWGVELRADYPYLATDGECPYKKDDWHKAGYKRPLVTSYYKVGQRSLWPTVMKLSGPMLAILRVPKDFSAYGGMVHEGRNCAKDDGYHAMLLVGHGIEDNQEYWLFRNSHGYYWGEAGYFKLSKRASDNCFDEIFDATFDFLKAPQQPIEITEGHVTRKLTPSEARQRGLIKLQPEH